MANENFVVHTGIVAGQSTIDAATGNIVTGGSVRAQSVYTDNLRFANGSPFVSTTIANSAEIVANISSGTNVGLTLTPSGVVAGSYGSATSIPTIVVDSKGRVTSLSTNTVSTTISLAGTTGTGSIAGGGTLTFATTNGVAVAASGSTLTISTAQDLRTTASPSFSAITASGAVQVNNTLGATGVVTFTNPTNSTSSTTGALVVTGGVGVGGNVAATNYLLSGGLYWAGNNQPFKSGLTLTAASTPPASPQLGDQWISTANVIYEYVNDGVSSYWLDIYSPSLSYGVAGNVMFSGHAIPAANVTYDLGTPGLRWRDLYLSGNTITLGNASISSSGTAVQVSNLTVTGTITAAAVTGELISRVVTIASGSSMSINADVTDIAVQNNTEAMGTLTINAPTGTLVDGQKLMIRLTTANSQTFSWNAVFAGSTDQALPTVSSAASKTDYMGFIYNSAAAKWQMIAKNFGF